MTEDIDLNDYYFIRAFSKREYAQDFINGTLYISALSNHKKAGNNVQFDTDETVIFRSSYGIKAKYYICDGFPAPDDKGFDLPFEEVRNDCYALCFYMIEKNHIIVESKDFLAANMCVRDAISDFLNNYGDCYIFVIDANPFVQYFDNHLNRSGISFVRGKVKYVDDVDLEKAKCFDTKNLSKIHLIKNKNFSYQNEYRYLFQRDSYPKDHLIFNIGIFADLVLWKGQFSSKKL